MPENKYESQRRWNAANYQQLNIAVRPELVNAFRTVCTQAQTTMRETIVTLMAAYCETPPVIKEQKAWDYTTRGNRRKATADIIAQLGVIRNAEEKYKQNMPVNLRNSSRYDSAEQAVEALDEAIGILEDAFS